MAENLARQKEFVKNNFPNYKIIYMDNNQEPGVKEEDTFPTDMGIVDSDGNELNIQFTDLEATDFTRTYRRKVDRYNKKIRFKEFLKLFIEDKKAFSEESIVQVFDTNKLYEIIDFVNSGTITVIDIEIGDVEYEDKMVMDIEKNQNFLNIKEKINDLLKYSSFDLTIENKKNVRIKLCIREHYRPKEVGIQIDFMPAYSANIIAGLEKVLKNKNKYKEKEKENLKKWGINKKNHILVCQIFEFINPKEFLEIDKFIIKSDKYKEICLTYDNRNILKIKCE